MGCVVECFEWFEWVGWFEWFEWFGWFEWFEWVGWFEWFEWVVWLSALSGLDGLSGLSGLSGLEVPEKPDVPDNPEKSGNPGQSGRNLCLVGGVPAVAVVAEGEGVVEMKRQLIFGNAIDLGRTHMREAVEERVEGDVPFQRQDVTGGKECTVDLG